MVMAHSECPEVIGRFIYMFHMPLFFIMSGYCFKKIYLNEPKRFLIRRLKGLYVPFVKYSLLFLVFHNVFFHLNIYNAEYGYKGNISYLFSSADFIKKAVLIVTTMSGNEQLLGGYWFLRCLLLASLISLVTIKYIKPVKGAILLAVAANVFALIPIPHINYVSLIFMSALFFMIGHIIRKYNVPVSGKYALTFAAITFVGSRLIHANMREYSAWQVIPYCLFATLGTLMIGGGAITLRQKTGF